jgi:glutamyl-Q tRNA(Asp) synthetase
MTVTRFAPSPSGFLHLGHAFAAWFAWTRAMETGGRFLVRIEDLDRDRCRPEYEVAILDDLAWLGLDWSPPVVRQSERFAAYEASLAKLDGMDLLYPCFCTRREIEAEIAAAATAPHLVQPGPDGPLYPGTCRRLSSGERSDRIARGDAYALRLDMPAAVRRAGPLAWRDLRRGEQTARPDLFGDVVLARKDTPASYHLAVVVDDADQAIGEVTRGSDLFAATHVHRLLQALLGLPVPVWHHHALVRDNAGRRLAKRAPAFTLRSLRAAGHSATEVLDEARRRAA